MLEVTPVLSLSGHEQLPLTVRNGGDPWHTAAQRKLVHTAQGNLGHRQMEAGDYHIWWPQCSGEFGWPSQQPSSPSYLTTCRNSCSSTFHPRAWMNASWTKPIGASLPLLESLSVQG